jgi:hypothetical protein
VHNRFADQKYLDNWVTDFKQVQEILIPGTGVSPWNLEKFSYQIRNGKIFVDEHPLVYFHFHHLRIFNGYFAVNGLRHYKVLTPNKAIKLIYHTYLKTLKRISRKLAVSDNKIFRVNYVTGGLLLQKLLNTDGYWFFTGFFIIHLNPYRRILKIKSTIKNING